MQITEKPMPITNKMDNKVVASARVSRPIGELGDFKALNPDLARNPSQVNGSNPPTVPKMRDAYGSPEWPMKQK
jgi:hypothetical protein